MNKIASGLVLVLFFIVLLSYVLHLHTVDVGEELKTKRTKIKTEKEAREKAPGYPASESQVIPGRFYLCNGAVWQANTTRTNYFAILIETAPDADNKVWKITGTNRLFELPLMLTRGAVYLAGKGASNIVYQQVATLPQNTN